MLVIIKLVSALPPFFLNSSLTRQYYAKWSCSVPGMTTALSASPLEELRQYSWKWGSKFLPIGTSSERPFPLTWKTFYSSRSEGESQDYILQFYCRNQEMEGGIRTHFKNPETHIGCRPVLCCVSVSLPLHAVNFLLRIALAHVSFSSHLQEVRDRPGREFGVPVLMHGVRSAGRLFK